MSNLVAATEPLPTYRANCGRCGGRGGQAVHGPREWADCDCVAEVDCALCDELVDVREDVYLIILDGREQAICHSCSIKEPDDGADPTADAAAETGGSHLRSSAAPSSPRGARR